MKIVRSESKKPQMVRVRQERLAETVQAFFKGVTGRLVVDFQCPSPRQRNARFFLSSLSLGMFLLHLFGHIGEKKGQNMRRRHCGRLALSPTCFVSLDPLVTFSHTKNLTRVLQTEDALLEFIVKSPKSTGHRK